jgi:hypothetical protein
MAGLAKAVNDDDINAKLLVEFTGIPREDWLVMHWQSPDLLRPAHCICVDRRLGALVIAIRGTMSASDAVTDLAATPGPLLVCHSAALIGPCLTDELLFRRMDTATAALSMRRDSWPRSIALSSSRRLPYAALEVFFRFVLSGC